LLLHVYQALARMFWPKARGEEEKYFLLLAKRLRGDQEGVFLPFDPLPQKARRHPWKKGGQSPDSAFRRNDDGLFAAELGSSPVSLTVCPLPQPNHHDYTE
jgi:hypothetical protein